MRRILAVLIILIQWLAPLGVLYYLPTKALVILAGLAFLTGGIGPICVLVVWIIISFAVLECVLGRDW